MKYFFWFMAFVFVVLTIAYRRGTLPENQEVRPESDFIYLSAPPAKVGGLLQKYCYNCHSAQAQYPRLAHFAPFHKKYIEPVTQGRKKLNFSKWDAYTPELQKVLLLVAVEQMENNAMPVSGVFSVDDTLASMDKQLLMQWLAQEAEAGM